MTTEASRIAATRGKKVEMLANADESTATIILGGEDHTLGNSIRYILSKQDYTDFVGYSIPHPSEQKINLRLQTKPIKQKNSNVQQTVTVSEAMNHSLDFLSSMCDILTKKFEEAELTANKRGIQKYSKPELNEKEINKLVLEAKSEALKIRQQHENTNMEEQD